MGRNAPRPAALALREVLQRSAPHTGLAASQTAWADAVGEAIAAVTEPVGEREGTLTVRCQSATWAHELSLMQNDLLQRLGERLEGPAPSAIKFLVG